MTTTLRRFSLTNDLVQIPIDELKELLEPNFFRISINANQVEVIDEDVESPLSPETLKKAEEARKIPLSECTQLVK